MFVHFVWFIVTLIVKAREIHALVSANIIVATKTFYFAEINRVRAMT